MPDLTSKENELLKVLTTPGINMLGKARMKELSMFIHRLMFLADESERGKRKAELLANAFWLIGSGALTEQEILARPGLTEQEREDMLAMLQLRFDAVAWREHTGFDLPNLPSVTGGVVTETISSLPSLTRSDD